MPIRKYTVTLEVEAERADLLRWTKTVSKAVYPKIKLLKIRRAPGPPKAGLEVVFIYRSGSSSPCHAVIKKMNGPWTVNRHGFCGVEPDYGPMAVLTEPDGGLCRTCAKYVTKVDGRWVTRKDAPIPKPKQRAYPPPCDHGDDD
jgi:hypothetical protein